MLGGSILVGTFAFGALSTATDYSPLVRREESTKTDKGESKYQPWKTLAPSQISSYHADMHSLHSQIKNDPMFTSMNSVLKTAIPQSYREAVMTNPASVRAEYKSTPPPWYKDLPADVKSFMEGNQKAAKSIWSKDLGPLPTSAPNNKQKSDAPGFRLYGATCIVFGAFGVALLLL